MNLTNILHIFFICLSCAQPGLQRSDAGARLPPVTIGAPIPGATDMQRYLPLVKGKRVAAVVNHSSRIRNVHVIDTLQHSGISIVKVFAPEHGFRGTADAGEHIENDKDPATGIPIVSLYGERMKPGPEDLAGVDIMLFDIQDVGVRFYTYISTLYLVMEACAENNIPMIILDRPNPNGYYIDGPVLYPEFKSFVGMLQIPVVYGMTMGELALMINGEGWLGNNQTCALTVIPCQEYDHSMTYDLPVPPSPNLPNHRSVLLYPSLCLFEGTNVSVGRGTMDQFQVLGHPGYSPGLYTFTPEPSAGAMSPLHKGTRLYGTNLTHLKPEEIQSWKRLNLHWLIEYHRFLEPKGQFYLKNTEFFDKLAGNSNLRGQLKSGMTEEQIRSSWQADLQAFAEKRKKYLLYPDFSD